MHHHHSTDHLPMLMGRNYHYNLEFHQLGKWFVNRKKKILKSILKKEVFFHVNDLKIRFNIVKKLTTKSLKNIYTKKGLRKTKPFFCKIKLA